MANYKVVNADQLDADLKSVADSIRAKAGTMEKMEFPDGFKGAVDGIEQAKEEQEKTVDITENGTTEIFPDEGKVLSGVTVNVEVKSSNDEENIAKAIIERTITEISDETVTRIGDYAFSDCVTLTSVNMPFVTDIGYSAFRDCASLTSAGLPVATKIGDYGFMDCKLLEIAAFPLVESVGTSSFQNCASLRSVDIPLASYIPYACFKDCRKITSAYFPLATKIDNDAFRNCDALTSINMPLATSIGDYGFYGCDALASAKFPCVTYVGSSAFGYCTSLTNVDLPIVSSINSYVFRNCTALTSLILRNESQVCTLSSSNAFNNTPIASGTGYIYVPSALIDSYKSATNWSAYATQFRALEDYTVDGTVTGELDETKIAA